MSDYAEKGKGRCTMDNQKMLIRGRREKGKREERGTKEGEIYETF